MAAALAAFGLAMLAALWAYDGWNNMPMAAGEVKDPGRNVPRALIGGMVAVMAIYCAANLAYFYALPWGDVLTSNSTAHRDALPVATKAAQTAFGESGGKLMSIAFVLSALGALNGATLTGARVPFAMARDGLFPARAGVLSARTRVPVAAVLMQAAWACVLAASGTYDQLTDYVIFASWIFYGLVTSAVFVLRFRAPDLPRPYRTLGYPVVPLVFVAGCRLARGQHAGQPSGRVRRGSGTHRARVARVLVLPGGQVFDGRRGHRWWVTRTRIRVGGVTRSFGSRGPSLNQRTPRPADSRIARPAARRLSSRISEYLRDRMMPWAPPLNVAFTAW